MDNHVHQVLEDRVPEYGSINPSEIAARGLSRKGVQLILNVFRRPMAKAKPYKPPANQRSSLVSLTFMIRKTN